MLLPFKLIPMMQGLAEIGLVQFATQLATTGFNPLSLFGAGEQGVWYDPSDTTTLFQDSAGTTPVTASGQPVGLMLDKSKGLVRGPELAGAALFNPGTVWTATAPTLLRSNGIVSGQLEAEVIGNYTGSARVYQTLTFSANTWYTVKAKVSSSAGTTTGYGLEVFIPDGATLAQQQITDGGGRELRFYTGTSTTLRVGIAVRGDSEVVGQKFFLSSLSIRELPGHHATQPTAASRPIYRRGDSRGVVNLLVNSSLPQGVPSATGSGGTVTSNLATGWAGGLPTTGVNIVPGGGTSFVYISRDTADNAAHTFSAYIKMDDGLPPAFGSATGSSVLNDFTLTIDNTATNPLTYVVEPTQDPTVFRVSVSIVTSVRSSSGNGPAKFSTNSARGFTASGFQLNLGPTALPYQRNDATLGGVATGASTDLHWLETDGVDDGMATGNIDFTGTDKVSVFAGVRKLSDAASGVVCELSASESSFNGSFRLSAPASAGAQKLFFVSKGSFGVGIDTTSSAWNAPVSAVVSCNGDIAGDAAVLRANGTVLSNSSADQGTGNYGNYPLYLFRRGGVSLPFNGWFYGMAITGRLTTDAETAATERFLAAKSAVVIP